MLKKATFSPAQPRRVKTRRSAGKAAAYESILPNQLNSGEDLWLKSLMSIPINFSSTLGR
jgi:hypothetical protein